MARIDVLSLQSMGQQTVLLEPKDVARMAGVNKQTVKIDALRGRIPLAARTPRGIHLFTVAAAERYAKSRKLLKRR